MNLNEVGLEVIGNGVKFIRSFTIRRDAAKTLYPRQLVPGNTKPMGALFGNSDPTGQFLLQQIGFIYNPSYWLEGFKRGRGVTHSGRERGVHFSATCSRIFARRAEWSPRSYLLEGPRPGTRRERKRRRERPSAGGTQHTHLIVSADGSDVNDGVGVVKERCPAVPLPTRPANVIQPPLYCAIVVLDNERVFRDANCLDPSVEHVVDGRHVSAFGHPIDLIKETVG